MSSFFRTIHEKLSNTAFDMIAVKGGTFKMGSNESDDEKPIHEVKVSDFYIGKYEVTIEQYMQFVNETKTHYPKWLEKGNSYNINENGSDKDYYRKIGMSLDEKDKNRPITGVSWNDAVAYAKWLSQKTGKKYRLPTEAEWEYAARGGVKMHGRASQYKYAGSNNIDEVAEYKGNNNKKTKPVGGKKANELGIYDMSGNVWEWCQDKWHSNYKGAPTDGSAWENGSGSSRVYRGGSWHSSAGGCRVAIRNYISAGFRRSNLGFRLALSPIV